MKKLTLLIALLFSIAFTSCSTDELPTNEPDAWIVKEVGVTEYSATWKKYTSIVKYFDHQQV